MPNLHVTIVRFVDEYQPGIVECEFTDANGRIHRLIDKVPMFTQQNLWTDSIYPQHGDARCEILANLRGAAGQKLIRISLARPDGLESTDGNSEFVVKGSQISVDNAL